MHHKFCIIDKKILFNGSYNWTYYADKLNRENTIRFINNKPLIEEFLLEFEELTQKYRRYKRVKKHSLSELMNFQNGNEHNLPIAKELEANSLMLIKNKKFELAEKVLNTAIRFSNDSEQKKIASIQYKVNLLSKQIVKNEITESKINIELHKIEEKKTILANTRQTYQPAGINKNNPNKKKIFEIQKRRILDLKLEENLLKSLKRDKFHGDFGDLRINLKWSTYDDLDLHIIDPSRNHIFFGNKEAYSNNSKGQLDIDANGGSDRNNKPQENIFWEKDPPSGNYKVIVDHYSVKQMKEVPFILSIIPKKGKSKILFSKIHFDDFKTMLVAEFKYLKTVGITNIAIKKSKTSI